MHVWERKSRSSVVKNRKSFHLVRVLSRQWRVINFRMHRSDDCRSWNFITNVNRWAHVSFWSIRADCESDQSLVCANRLWIRSITGVCEQIVNQINHWSVRTDFESDQSLVCVNRLWIRSITGLCEQIVNQINHWSVRTDCESDQSLVCVNR